MDPILDGYLRAHGASDGDEALPEDQSFPGNVGDLPQGPAGTEHDAYVEALPKGLQLLPSDLGHAC